MDAVGTAENRLFTSLQKRFASGRSYCFLLAEWQGNLRQRKENLLFVTRELPFFVCMPTDDVYEVEGLLLLSDQQTLIVMLLHPLLECCHGHSYRTTTSYGW